MWKCQNGYYHPHFTDDKAESLNYLICDCFCQPSESEHRKTFSYYDITRWQWHCPVNKLQYIFVFFGLDFPRHNTDLTTGIVLSEQFNWKNINWDFFFFNLFRDAPAAYVSSQAGGQIGAIAAGLHHSHRNAGSRIQATSATYTTVQLMATQDPRPTEQGQGWNPLLRDPSQIHFCCATTGTPKLRFRGSSESLSSNEAHSAAFLYFNFQS